MRSIFADCGWWLAFACIYCPPTFALDPAKKITQYSMSVWQTEDGLPQNSVQALLQARDGYLWVGTQEGLARFDGVRFTVFDRKNTPQLPHNNVRALVETPDGALWAGTTAGLVRFKDGVFESYDTTKGLAHRFVRSLYVDRAGTLWVGTYGGGVSHLREGVFENISAQQGLANDFVNVILEDQAGRMWFGTNSGLSCLESGRVTNYTTRHGLSHDFVGDLYVDRRGTLWVGTKSGLSIYRGDEGGGHGDPGDQVFSGPEGADSLPGVYVRTIKEDREGNLWVGTGVGLYRLSDRVFSALTAEHGMSDAAVLTLCEDLERNLWVGTNNGGVIQLRDGKFTNYAVKEGLPHNEARAVFQARDGSMWFGAGSGGLTHLSGGRFTTYTVKDGLADDTVRAIAEDLEGNLWAGTANGGLSVLRDGRFTNYTQQDGLGENYVLSITPTRDGSVWVGTYGGGAARWRDGRFTNYTQQDGLASSVVRSIHEARDGTLWLSTNDGLSRYRDGHFTTYTTRDGLSHNFTYSFHEEADGTLWIGTFGGGLNRYKDGVFTKFTAEQGLFDDVVFRIMEDARGNLWMSCNRGIYRVSKKNLDDVAAGRAARVECEVFNAADGMPSPECNGGAQPAGFKTADGKLWFPTIRGYAVIDPERIRRNDLPPPVFLERLDVNKRSVAFDQFTRFPPGHGEMAFHYTALSYLAPKEIHFKYKLEGFDADWVDAGTRREAYYTNLPPGDYTFRVIASNSDGVWNERGASFAFYLRPHFYQTYWFWTVGAIGAIGVIVALSRLRVKNMRRRERELVRLVDERTRGMQQELGERQRAELALRVSEERYALAARGANDGLWDWDLISDRVYYSPRWKEMLGCADDEVGSSPADWFERVHPQDRALLRAQIEEHLSGRTAHLECEYRALHAQSSYRWMLCRALAVRDEANGGHAARLAGSQTDVTSRKNAEERLMHEALHDALTDLPNRTMFMNRLGAAITHAAQSTKAGGQLFAVLFLDLDRFKVINDSLGHATGDRLLIEVAARVNRCVRPGDTVARLGGDEFTVLLEEIGGADDAELVAERIREEIAAPFHLGGQVIFVSASVGIRLSSFGSRTVAAAAAADSPDAFLRDADAAMYQAKSLGRSRCEMFDEEMHTNAVEQMQLESDLRRAVERGEFELHYQPVVELASGRVVGYEALARWRHPELGLVPPAKFIPIAEESNLIVALGHWVIEEACRQIAVWRRELPGGADLTVNVNVSGKQLLQGGFAERVRRALDDARLSPRSLKLEITESVMMQNSETARSLLLELLEFSVELLLDDFGTGYSSLSYLHRLPVCALKIDRSFVWRIGEEEKGGGGEIVSAVLSLARSLNIGVVAEGIETVEQLKYLKAMGCDYGQGYLFAPPLGADAVRQYRLNSRAEKLNLQPALNEG